MAELFFSIVIPTYNRADFLPKTLASLLSQTYPHFEIIIVDDGSTDNTEIAVQSLLSDKVTYHRKSNAERAAARNFGAKLAKGEYVNFFDSDDLAYPDHLQTARAFINKHSQPEIFHLGYDIKDGQGKLMSKVDAFHGQDLNAQLIDGNVLSCNGVFLRKDVALQYPFHEDRALSASEDYELWLRLAARYPILYDNTITSTVINHDARSVLVINKENLIHRQQVFITHLFEDPVAMVKYKLYKGLLTADTYTYVSLHLALTKKYRIEVIEYLWKAFTVRPAVVGRKRFWASLKHLF
jgi:glycosyltransferase involved in cell wall biosynthesis